MLHPLATQSEFLNFFKIWIFLTYPNVLNIIKTMVKSS